MMLMLAEIKDAPAANHNEKLLAVKFVMGATYDRPRE